ncbi:hypothetical protein ND16A_3589 [Thalassotalea sp. ND16A]|nr:hypothetical protein [Thalassotalea sp. ND16A]KGK00382.1 hypothetical protein ND16A_3589 [Thalassotalea sp. ND16A]
MRIMRSQAQWQAIIEDQQTSGLAIIDYRLLPTTSIITTSFYAVRKKLGLSSGNFVRAKITKQVGVIEEYCCGTDKPGNHTNFV